MRRFFFICSLQFLILFCSCQTKEELWVTKYGPDQKDWPIWTRAGNDFSNGMMINEIDLNLLYYANETIAFKSDQSYKENTIYNRSTRIQNGLTFIEGKDKWKFSGTFVNPEDLTPLEHEVVYNGNILNELKMIKAKYDSSYMWRDGYPNMLHGYIEKINWSDLTVVLFGVKNSKDLLKLFYYKNELIFIHREAN